MALTASNIATCIMARARVNSAFGSFLSAPTATPRAAQSVTTSAVAGLDDARPDASPMHRAKALAAFFSSMSSSGQSELQAGCSPALPIGEHADATDARLEGFIIRSSGFH